MTIDTTTLASLTWLVGIVSSVLSVIVMLNPLRFVLEVTSSAETTTSNNNKKNISVPTFVALFGNFLIWNAYGLITRNSIVFVQNMLGVVFSAFYLYRLYFCKALAPELKRQMAIGVGAIMTIIVIIGVLFKLEMLNVSLIGWVADLFSLAVFAAPLSELMMIVRTKSTESLSFSFALTCWLSAACWSVYGVLVGDVNILLPNALGFMLTCIQLSLFVLYPNKKKKNLLFL
jgi:solute carrier family 50 protein (sugar transporter)